MTATDHIQLIELANRLFVFTDEKSWSGLTQLVFTEEVDFDMTSMGGDKDVVTAQSICDGWAEGLAGIDSVNHLAGNYLVTIDDDSAEIFCYATATHYKKDAQNGHTREFVGTYELGAIRTLQGWRLNTFKYNLKYATGNLDLS